MASLTIALAKGRLEQETVKRLQQKGMAQSVDGKSRKLVFYDKHDDIAYLFVKPVDVITYVEHGIADIGIVGKDIILEQDRGVYELLDLQFGKCMFAVCGMPETSLHQKTTLKVATKFVNITKAYFKDRLNLEIVYLNGSVELAPLLGMADVIVDLVETGSTLKANGLVVLEKMFDITAQVIAGPSSYLFKEEKIKQVLSALTPETEATDMDYSWE